MTIDDSAALVNRQAVVETSTRYRGRF